jgi:hypothetical protein
MVPFYKVNPVGNLNRQILRKGSSVFFKGQQDGLPIFVFFPSSPILSLSTLGGRCLHDAARVFHKSAISSITKTESM